MSRLDAVTAADPAATADQLADRAGRPVSAPHLAAAPHFAVAHFAAAANVAVAFADRADADADTAADESAAKHACSHRLRLGVAFSVSYVPGAVA